MIEMFPSGPFATNAYVLDSNGVAAIFDPSPGSLEMIRKYVEEKGLRVEKIYITHSHWDHIVDTAVAQAEYGAPVFVHPLDVGNLENPGSDGIPMMVEVEAVKPVYTIADGEVVSVGDIELDVLHTPGHSPGSVCFYAQSEGFLIGGDLIFRGSIGNLSLPTAKAQDMWASLERIANLPPETIIYPGHGEPTTVGEESWLKDAKNIFGGG